MDVDLRAITIVILTVVCAATFLLRLRRYTRYHKMRRKILEERELFVTTFDPSSFTDFDAFTFQVHIFSHVSPFPTRSDGEWRYVICLTKQEAEDIDTVIHEITECTLGRAIEKLLQLKKPLYLLRRQEEKFWINGKQQKYLPEHLLATLSELDTIPKETLEQRIAPEDVKTWQIATN